MSNRRSNQLIGAPQRGTVTAQSYTEQQEVKASIDELIRVANVSKERYSDSRAEAEELWKLYDGEHYTDAQCKALMRRGSPVEYKSVFTQLAQAIQGYFQKVQVRTVIQPRGTNMDNRTTQVHQAYLDYVKSISDFPSIQGEVILDSLLSGLAVVEYDVYPTSMKDEFGMVINDIKIKPVPANQVMLDPNSVEYDYSDALYIHRWKWVGQRYIRQMFGSTWLSKLTSRHIAVEGFDDTEFYEDDKQTDLWADEDRFFIMETQYRLPNGKIERIFWHDRYVLKREILPTQIFTYRPVKFKVERATNQYYGDFKLIKGNQIALNQAIVTLQGILNGFKVIAQEGSVGQQHKREFNDALYTPNQVAYVNNVNGIMIHNLQPQAQTQKEKIVFSNQAMFEVLGLNPAFLGFGDASSSGRKVGLQQNAAINSLTRLDTHLKRWNKYVVLDIMHLASVYKNAHEYITLTDEFNQQAQIEVNQPEVLRMNVGDTVQYVPHTIKGKDGIVRYKTYGGTGLDELQADVEIFTSDMNGSESVDAVMLDQLLNGMAGQALMNANPAAYFYAMSLKLKNLKTKHSEEIAQIYGNLAMQMGYMPTLDPRAAMTNQTGVLGNVNGAAGQLAEALGATSDLAPQGYNQGDR